MLEELRTSLLEVPLLEAALLDDTLLKLSASLPLSDDFDSELLEVTLLELLPLELDLPLLEDTLLELSTSLPLSDDFDAELLEPPSLPLLEDTPPTGIHSSSEQV
jgi:hypothetical protein